jgi:hypothetical protein
VRLGKRLHAPDRGLSHPHRRRAEGHRRHRGARGRRGVRQGSPHRPGRHGRGRVRQPDAFQGTRDDGFGGAIKNIGRAGLPGRQDRAAQRGQGLHRRGQVPGLHGL